MVSEATVEELRRIAAPADLASFIEHVFRDEHGDPIRIQPFQMPIISVLEDDTIDRVLIIAPPGSGKTTVVAVAYPLWRIGRNPSETVLLVCNTDMQAQARSAAAQEVITGNERYSGVFPNVKPGRKWGTSEWHVERPNPEYPHATLFAAGTESPKTQGFRGSLILIDDPMSQKEARSEQVAGNMVRWYRQTVYPRLLPGGKMVAILTRWSDMDCGQAFIDDGWRVIHIPALTDDGSYWESRFPAETLRQIRARDPGEFACVYQGDPSQLGSAKIDRSWLKYIEPDKVPTLERRAAFCDLAISTKTQADNTAIGLGGVTKDGDFYLLDVECGKWHWPDAKQIIAQFVRRHGVRVLGFQASVFEQMAVDELRALPEMSGVAFHETSTRDDKVMRFEPVVDRAFHGKLYLANGDWVDRYVREVCSFPIGQHDDQVDMTSGLVEIIGNAVVAAGATAQQSRKGAWGRSAPAAWRR